MTLLDGELLLNVVAWNLLKARSGEKRRPLRQEDVREIFDSGAEPTPTELALWTLSRVCGDLRRLIQRSLPTIVLRIAFRKLRLNGMAKFRKPCNRQLHCIYTLVDFAKHRAISRSVCGFKSHYQFLHHHRRASIDVLAGSLGIAFILEDRDAFLYKTNELVAHHCVLSDVRAAKNYKRLQQLGVSFSVLRKRMEHSRRGCGSVVSGRVERHRFAPQRLELHLRIPDHRCIDSFFLAAHAADLLLSRVGIGNAKKFRLVCSYARWGDVVYRLSTIPTSLDTLVAYVCQILQMDRRELAQQQN